MLIATPAARAEFITTRASFYSTPQPVACRGFGRFDPSKMTAAHPKLPCGTTVEVVRGNRSVIVTITDRGPFVAGRGIDLSRAAAAELGMINAGVAAVRYRVLKPRTEFQDRFRGCHPWRGEECQ